MMYLMQNFNYSNRRNVQFLFENNLKNSKMLWSLNILFKKSKIIKEKKVT